jgi:hypothetical protein
MRLVGAVRSTRAYLAVALCACVAVAYLPALVSVPVLGGGPSPAAALTYDQEVLADSPVAYWRLDETSGTVAHDSSGNGLNGTYSGAITFGQAGAVAGDSAAQFGDLASISVPDNNLLDLGTSANPGFAIELWIKAPPPTQSQYATIISKNNSGNDAANPYIIRFASNGDFLFGFLGDNNTLDSSVVFDDGATINPGVTNTHVLDNAWHHLVFTGDSTIWEAYVDGVRVGSRSPTHFAYNSSPRCISGRVWSISAGRWMRLPCTRSASAQHGLPPTTWRRVGPSRRWLPRSPITRRLCLRTLPSATGLSAKRRARRRRTLLAVA